MSELRTLKQRYITYLKTQWGGSPKMIENYDRYLERFLRFAKVKKPSEITAERVASFRLHLSKQPGANVGGKVTPMKQLTQNYYLIALRMFLKYLIDQGYETMLPIQIKLAKSPKRSIKIISTNELDRLRTAPDVQHPVGRRDHAIIELLCSTGLRISELCALSINDISLTSSELSIECSRGNQRMLFLNESVHTAIAGYMKDRQDASSALFIRYGRKANDGGDLRIHPRAVQRMLKAYATKVGIVSRVTPHALRHTFADQLVQSGADRRSVQVLLGHTTNAATYVYQPVANPRLPQLRKKDQGCK